MYSIDHTNKHNDRQKRGRFIAKKPENIIKIDESHYKIKSQSRDKHHDVIAMESGWSCSCEDSCFRKIRCKHICAIEILLSNRKIIKQYTIKPINVSYC